MASKKFDPITWTDGSGYPINAENLNRIEDGISNNQSDIDAIQTLLGWPADDTSTTVHTKITKEIERATDVENRITQTIGTSEDPSTSNTLYGAIKKVDERFDDYTKTKDIPVKGIADKDPILSINDGKVHATVSLEKSQDSKTIYLKGKGGTVLSTIDTEEFIKDGMLQKVEYIEDDNKLKFTWNTDSDVSSTTEIKLSKLVDTYTAGDGLSLSGKTFNVLVSSESENYLSVSENGLKISGIDKAISDAISEGSTTFDNIIIRGSLDVSSTVTDNSNTNAEG